LNPPDIGGRFSAMSLVGLVPAALMGQDLGKLLGRAERMLAACGPSVRAASNPGLRLGAALGTSARTGRDKLTLALAPKLASFGDWAEQLVAESTGKAGLGIIPVVGEPVGSGASYRTDRLFVGMGLGTDGTSGLRARARQGHPVIALRLNDPYDVAAEFVRWEVATAIAGHLLAVNPFDQPDVQSTKTHTARLLAHLQDAPPRPSALTVSDGPGAAAVWAKLRAGRASRYVAITAFFSPTPRRVALLAELRTLIGKRLGVATTLGYGPRFLHSTGQLHKGGPMTVTVLQLVADTSLDAPIPGAAYGFRALMDAQADGDHGALVAKGRTVLRVALGPDVDRGLDLLLDALRRPTRPASHAPRRPKARRR
jgi:glucose-6-phosphate isomerase/transaldolase/glucose-6-phosphate isomerase